MSFTVNAESDAISEFNFTVMFFLNYHRKDYKMLKTSVSINLKVKLRVDILLTCTSHSIFQKTTDNSRFGVSQSDT